MSERKISKKSLENLKISNQESNRITKESLEISLLQLLEKKELTKITISELVEMYEYGKEFYFVNPADMEGVFNIIVDYTNYIAWYINNSINLTYYKAEENPKLQQLLTDVVKLQNLGNRIFPIMTARDDMTYESKGLLGYLNKRRNLQGIRRLDFDPITRYGVTEDDFRNPDLFDANEKSFRIIDMKKSFNPRTAQFMENI